MAHFRKLLIPNFAKGMLHYEDHHPLDSENIAQIVLWLRVGSVESELVPFILDTGTPWCILDPLIAAPFIMDGMPSVRLLVRGREYEGQLHRLTIFLEDEEYGKTQLAIESTIFVPTLEPPETWPHPNFIGLDGFLNHFHFAIDPTENAFYFGALPQTQKGSDQSVSAYTITLPGPKNLFLVKIEGVFCLEGRPEFKGHSCYFTLENLKSNRKKNGEYSSECGPYWYQNRWDKAVGTRGKTYRKFLGRDIPKELLALGLNEDVLRSEGVVLPASYEKQKPDQDPVRKTPAVPKKPAKAANKTKAKDC